MGGRRMSFITVRQQEFGRNPKGGWEANIKRMYVRISISDSFITGFSLSILYVHVHDCQLKNSIADRAHALIFRNLHLTPWASWRLDISPKPRTVIYSKEIFGSDKGRILTAIIQFLSLSWPILHNLPNNQRLDYIYKYIHTYTYIYIGCYQPIPTFFPQKKRETKSPIYLRFFYRPLINSYIPYLSKYKYQLVTLTSYLALNNFLKKPPLSQ